VSGVAVYERVARVLPPRLAGPLDMIRPGVLTSWGGPLNGQTHRQRIVRDLARVIMFERVIETGTFRGTSTEFFAHVTGAPVSTVEASRRHYEFARRRFAGLPYIDVAHGDSRTFLRRQAAGSTDGDTLFYLDAHWEQDLPLREELEIIDASWPRAVVLVDDFEVPGDPGYAFDDYGHGKALTAGYLPAMEGWRTYYPSLPAAEETGARRGCVVLASPALAGAVHRLDSIRPA
jgi:predicted O-methyltransferase YrrM